MKNLLTLIPLAFLIFSCQEKEIKKENYRKIDTLLNIVFKDSFPNFIDNELNRNNALKLLERKKDSVIENNVLDDMPLEVFRVFKNPAGDGAIVHLVKKPTTEHYDFYQQRDTILSDFITFDLLVGMPENKASELTKGQMFLVKNKKHPIDINAIVDVFTNQTYYENELYIEHSMKKLNINYGILFTEADSLIPHKQ
ncbi:hypothetical protein [Myroides pelagicus]|uniref:Lipoprotein n=1 Tax=Myroides pelagicus TaxID=270914 RepID=A0A7K1GIR5_9FLAO|nr:hypothetical protein [Myroides pelagicus]MTH28429.1 hypothetical protein [Myroides pelagicus]